MTPARRSRGASTPPREAPDLFAFGDDGGMMMAPERLPEPELQAAPGESPAAAISVATLTRTVKDVLEGAFPPLWVRGEVSDFKQHRNGHWYFSLRDEEASLRCVVWSRDTRRIPAPPDEGMTVVALGQVSLYAARGDLQFTVKTMDAVGDGLWRKAFELTRARLERDGLLDPARKRALPFFPRRIAVITSADGAALHDIIAVTRRRNRLVELVLIPAAVQGEGAPASLCAALDRLASWGGADLAIIGRGGGSREDLWAFNDEQLARKVASCPIPIISAVGHEVDVSICDLVADWRAPTPSVAAEHAVPVLADLQRTVASLGRQLQSGAADAIRGGRRRLEQAARQGSQGARRLVERRRLQLGRLSGQLHALSPLATMARGYVVATSPAGRVVTSVAAIAPGDPLQLRLRDGAAETRVETVRRIEDPTDGQG
ncbi:MAG: exodeoxyribonuclease VII large subunit [Gemmatimonadetes bacterium]|nr:exodeoxyribonuclease VII large subunit [Gemmatimonadota bacterium]